MRDSRGWTALDEAANNGHVTVAQVLLEYGAENRELENKAGRLISMLRMAV
jgi:ankyrin repeat protein